MADPLTQVVIERPSAQNHVDALAFVERAKAITVRNSEEFEGAAAILKNIKGAAARIEEERKKLKAPILEAGKAVDRFFGEPLASLETAERTVKGKLVTYSNEQERLQREEQAKAEAKARKDREELEAKARKAAEEGKLERAAVLEERAASIVAPVIDRTPPKVAGVSYRETWKFRILDAAKVPRQYCDVSEAKIRKVVQALKHDTLIEGVEVYMEKEIAAGSA